MRDRAKHRCEECGIENYTLGGREEDGTFLPAIPKGEKLLRLEWPEPGEFWWCELGEHRSWLRIVRIVLTVAHLNHTPEDCDLSNLKALCQRCHNRYDAATRARGIKERERDKRAGADLFPEYP